MTTTSCSAALGESCEPSSSTAQEWLSGSGSANSRNELAQVDPNKMPESLPHSAEGQVLVTVPKIAHESLVRGTSNEPPQLDPNSTCVASNGDDFAVTNAISAGRNVPSHLDNQARALSPAGQVMVTSESCNTTQLYSGNSGPAEQPEAFADAENGLLAAPTQSASIVDDVQAEATTNATRFQAPVHHFETLADAGNSVLAANTDHATVSLHDHALHVMLAEADVEAPAHNEQIVNPVEDHSIPQDHQDPIDIVTSVVLGQEEIPLYGKDIVDQIIINQSPPHPVMVNDGHSNDGEVFQFTIWVVDGDEYLGERWSRLDDY